MFLHVSFLHIVGNMLYLWVFGDNIEDSCGRVRFVILYLAAGLSAALAYISFSPASTIPAVGASGAISGIVGAYMVVYHYARVKIIDPVLTLFLPLLALLFAFVLPFIFWLLFVASLVVIAVTWIIARRKISWEVSAVWLLLFWFVFQALWAFIYGSLNVPPITYLAHIAGFVSGFFLVHFLQIKKEIPEYRRAAYETPKSVAEIYRVKDIESKLKPEAVVKRIKCKTCGTMFDVTISKKTITVKCPSCGSKGKIKIS
jgi:membrane associated rhomboid family serine protease/DNA-directed RNA polymerase subunit RPC12/RpoP